MNRDKSNYYYRPGSLAKQGGNALGRVRPFVCPFLCLSVCNFHAFQTNGQTAGCSCAQTWSMHLIIFVNNAMSQAHGFALKKGNFRKVAFLLGKSVLQVN